jgi:fumarate reductase (CoM/CoB) subunit A
MTRYDPQRQEGSTRDVAARGIFDQIRQGLDLRGGVRLDLSALSEESFIRSNPKVWRGLQNKHIDFKTYEFIVAPEAHYWMGGVRIDERAESSLRGLFATGEVAGGIQGGNRLNSNALPETQVFGERGGRAAAELARDAVPQKPPAEAIRRWEQTLASLGEGEPIDDFDALRAELQQQMWISLGIVREATSLRAGLVFARALRVRLASCRPANSTDLRDWVELQFMCEVGELGLTAALLREESRGAHYRDDFPEPDPAWHRTILLQRDEWGALCHSFEPLPSAERAEAAVS